MTTEVGWDKLSTQLPIGTRRAGIEMLASGSVLLAAPARQPQRGRQGAPMRTAGPASASLAQSRSSRRAARVAGVPRQGGRMQLSCAAFLNLTEKPKADVPDIPPTGKYNYKYLYDGACSVCKGLVRCGNPAGNRHSGVRRGRCSEKKLRKAVAPQVAMLKGRRGGDGIYYVNIASPDYSPAQNEGITFEASVPIRDLPRESDLFAQLAWSRVR